MKGRAHRQPPPVASAGFSLESTGAEKAPHTHPRPSIASHLSKLPLAKLPFRNLWRAFSDASGLRFQGRSRRLQLQESIQLGEKRFVAILRVDGDEFLLGGGASGISILGQLQPETASQSFGDVLGLHGVGKDRA